MSRPFPWDNQRDHGNLRYALRDQISADSTRLECIWKDARIGSHANGSLSSIPIGNEAIQAFTNCLNGEQIRNLDSGVEVLGYNEDGKPYDMKLKKNTDGHAVLEGPWGSIMQQKGWSQATRICFWGLPYEGRNSGKPRFVFTDNI